MANRFARRKALHGRMAYVTAGEHIVGKGGFVAGGEQTDGRIVVGASPDTTSIFDDFHGDLVGDEWNYAENDTGFSGVNVAGTNGIFRLLGSNTPATLTAAGNAAVFNGGQLDWKPDQGPGKHGHIRMAARVRVEEVNRVTNRAHVFVGFTDTVAAEAPTFDTGAGLAATADDFMGFLLSAGGDTGWMLVSNQGGGTPQVVASGKTPTSNVYSTLEVSFESDPGDTGGTATFYVDGVPVGSISNPVAHVAMSPQVSLWQQDTGARYVDVDWMNVSGLRDTGS